MKKTKIVATIGPASDSKDILRELIRAGLNVCRINFSHGTYESNGKVITEVRELSKELGVPVVKVVVPGLESSDGTAAHTPGARARKQAAR